MGHQLYLQATYPVGKGPFHIGFAMTYIYMYNTEENELIANYIFSKSIVLCIQLVVNFNVRFL